MASEEEKVKACLGLLRRIAKLNKMIKKSLLQVKNIEIIKKMKVLVNMTFEIYIVYINLNVYYKYYLLP